MFTPTAGLSFIALLWQEAEPETPFESASDSAGLLYLIIFLGFIVLVGIVIVVAVLARVMSRGKEPSGVSVTPPAQQAAANPNQPPVAVSQPAPPPAPASVAPQPTRAANEVEYDGFISYRRGTGAATARLWRPELRQQDKRVFFGIVDLSH